MAAVYDVDFGFGDVAAIGFGLGGVEGRFVLAPDYQEAGLILAHPGVPLRIVLHVGAVVVEEVDLDLALAGLVEKIIFVGPEIAVVALDVGIVADVTGARGGQREEICAQRGFVGSAIGPEGAARFPIFTQAFVVATASCTIRASTRSGCARIMRKPTGPP